VTRPDPVWHHPLGRKKYKHFLEQPTSLTGAGESLIPEEYHIVKNKGIQSLEFYEAFTVQLKDDEQKLRVFPSRPSGRLEVVQLMTVMDDMLEKAGVDQQSEELTELSELEGLLELVKVEQNIYNIVFHELIRQVSVGCAERGQLLAKLQRYQSLLDRIPRRLKALHTEVVAQRALDRRLTEEIHRIKTSIHELYELQRARLEAQLLQMTEDRDCWSQLTFCLALKVISVKKLQLVSRLHTIEQSWFKTAEHCILFLTSTDTEDLKNIMELNDRWKEQLTALMSQLKQTEHAQCATISSTQQGIAKWLSFCTTKNSADAKYDKTSVEELHADLKLWSNMLALQCEHYQGEKQLCCQQTLGEICSRQEKWLKMSLHLFRRHTSPHSEPPGGQQALRELDGVLSELLKELETQVSGENIHRRITSLLGLIESWVSKIGAVNGQPEMMSVSDWLKLEKALRDWQSLADEALQCISITQTESEKDQNKPDIVSSVHMAQTRWMLDLLILMVPDHSEEQNQEQEPHYIAKISLQTLDEDAKMLTRKLDYFSSYITRECVDWVETCMMLLSGVHGGPVELDSPVVRLIDYDGIVTQKKLGETSVHLNGTDELVVSPVTEETQKALSDLTTAGLLQRELDSEVRVKIAEERALKAEDDLQAALEKIKDLERQLQGRPSLESR
uniref:Axonemal dynein light chain domain containing 1 n=1 Tax=Stegastes partitus TaxID=144197 RepID=A0A3B5A2R9_9TELE